MKEFADYVKTGEDNYASQRDLLKVTTWYEGPEGRRTGEYASEAYEDYSQPGVIRWCSNDRCVPLDICERMYWYNMDAQRTAYEAETVAFITSYRKAQAEFDARTDPEADAIRAEQAAERRAAFGPGEEVVDVITGRRYRT